MKKEVENVVNNVVEEIGEDDMFDVTVLEPAAESVKGAFGKKLAIFGGITTLVGGVIYYCKHRDEIAEKRDEKRAAKLEATGKYKVIKVSEEPVSNDEDYYEDEDVQ